MPESITSADLGILAAIPRTQFLDRIMPVVTVIGDNGIIPIIIALILICIPKTRKTGIAMGIAFALGGIFGNLLLKNIVARTRPYDVVDGIKLLVPALSDYSFPSGHTLVCFEAATVAFVRERKYHRYLRICHCRGGGRIQGFIFTFTIRPTCLPELYSV